MNDRYEDIEQQIECVIIWISEPMLVKYLLYINIYHDMHCKQEGL